MAGNKILVRIHLFRESFIRMSLASLDLDPGGDGAIISLCRAYLRLCKKLPSFEAQGRH